MPSAVALLSSGLDSTVALAAAQKNGVHIELALTFDYGQRARAAEIRQSRKIAQYFKVPHRVLDLPWVEEFQAGLMGSGRFPALTQSELDDVDLTRKSAKAVWVPNRNGVFLEIAAGIAENIGAHRIIVGFNKEEAATFPDNSKEYIQAINAALAFSTANHVKVDSPTANLSKREIVELGIQLDVPFELLWSCYDDEKEMCGECESCQRLKRAFSANGVKLDAKFINAVL